MSMRTQIIFGIFLGVFVVPSGASYGFDEAQVSVVKSKLPDDYKPLGARFSAFLLEPVFEVSQVYDDNIFRNSVSPISDQITVFKPSLNAVSDWNLHQIRFGVSAEVGKYKSNSEENYEDYSYYVSGRYDLGYETFVDLSVRSEYRHQDRGSLEDVNGDNPVEFRVDAYRLGFTRALGKLKLYLNADFREYDYDNSRRGGVVIDNSDRNYQNNLYTLRLAYGYGENVDIYAEGRFDQWEYDATSSRFRSSDGREYRLGVDANLSHLLKAKTYVGYSVRDYAFGFDDVTSFTYGGDVLWNVSDLLSLTFLVDRRLGQTVLEDVSGVEQTNAALGAQYALRDNFYLDGYVRYRDDAYQGDANGVRRDSLTYETNVGLEYFVNRNVKAKLGYDYINRDYDVLNSDYDNHRLSVSLSFMY